MKTFIQFLENLNPGSVVISLDLYKKQAFIKAKELLDFASDRRDKLNNFKLDINLIKEGLKDFPMLSQLLNSISKNLDQNNWIEIVHEYEKSSVKELQKKHKKEIEEFKKNGGSVQDLIKIEQQKRNEESEFKYNIFKVIRHIYDYYDSKNNEKVNEKEYYDLAERAVDETNKNMINLKNKIIDAISSLEWNGSRVIISPSMPDSDEDPVPSSDSASIVVGKNGLFSYFSIDDGKFIVDDIIEGGEDDEDFFLNEKEKQDYYSLVDYLQNPNKKEQILTLYTARPNKDRDFYSKTDYLPANIFLSNSFDHIDGLANDLSSGDRRDIYKVKINSKYVIKTLDGPIKYYQVVKNAPIQSISLY
jgi:hypothetical protein